MWLWRQDDTVTLRWDNRGVLVNGLPIWEAGASEVHLPLAKFIAAVQSFNDRLIAAMAERVHEIQKEWTRPEIVLDVPALVREHDDRATWLAAAWGRVPARDHEWETVRDALAFLDEQRLPPRIGGQVG